MSLPLSVLENVLHPKQINFDENYIIELNNGELVTLGDLTNFWIEGHQKIKKALDIIKESKEKWHENNEGLTWNQFQKAHRGDWR